MQNLTAFSFRSHVLSVDTEYSKLVNILVPNCLELRHPLFLVPGRPLMNISGKGNRGFLSHLSIEDLKVSSTWTELEDAQAIFTEFFQRYTIQYLRIISISFSPTSLSDTIADQLYHLYSLTINYLAPDPISSVIARSLWAWHSCHEEMLFTGPEYGILTRLCCHRLASRYASCAWESGCHCPPPRGRWLCVEVPHRRDHLIGPVEVGLR